jgi:hypothetical protein
VKLDVNRKPTIINKFMKRGIQENYVSKVSMSSANSKCGPAALVSLMKRQVRFVHELQAG